MRIRQVRAFPLSLRYDQPQRTSQRAYTMVSICLIRVDTDDGIFGVGECLARFGATAYARLVEDLLRPRLLDRNPLEIGAIWDELRSTLNGRSGGILFEAIAGIDIALWDIKGKAFGRPLYQLFGGYERSRVPVYASSIMVGEDVPSAAERIRSCGFDKIKMKIGESVPTELERIATLRKCVGDDVTIMVDANYIYTEHEALQIADGAAEHRLEWLEEPLNPENRQAYHRLAMRSRVPLAAGESEFTAHDAADLITSRTVDYIQPDVTRHGGISECLRTAVLADIFDVKFAPHVGFSGAICVAASLHLAAAASNTYAVECMTTPSAFREELTAVPFGFYNQVEAGTVSVPQDPGLGIEIDWETVERLGA